MHIAGYLLLLAWPCACVGSESISSPFLSLNGVPVPAFAFRKQLLRHRISCINPGSRLHAQSTKQSNQLLDIVPGKNNNVDVESLQEFDTDLANDTQEALLSDVMVENDATPVAATKPDQEVNRSSSQEEVDPESWAMLMDVNGSLSWPPTNGDTNEIIRPLIDNKAPKAASPKMPPHTSLAQVVANQYSIDLASVSPSKPGSKITAEDVEYHAWILSQPPCSPEALELAYSLDINLNEFYDDDDREYVMQLSDVELFQENVRSLKIASQTKKGLSYDSQSVSSRQKAKKMNALDKRVEQNVGKLSSVAMKLAGTVAGGIIQQIQTQTKKVQQASNVFAELNGKTAADINSVSDFDADLASEIEAALSSVNGKSKDEEDTDGTADELGALKEIDADLAAEIQDALSSVAINGEPENGAVDSEEPEPVGMKAVLTNEIDDNSIEDSDADDTLSNIANNGYPVNGEIVNGVAGSEMPESEDMKADLANEIEDPISTSPIVDLEDGDADASVPEHENLSIESQEMDSDVVSLVDEVQGKSPSSAIDYVEDDDGASYIVPHLTASTSFSRDDLEHMTCVQLKELLRKRELKVSGKKAVLVDRLLAAISVDEDDGDNDDQKNDTYNDVFPFFSAVQ